MKSAAGLLDSIVALGALVRTSARLQREQWLAPAEIRALQELRLAQILRHAARAPYYREVFGKAGIDPGMSGSAILPRLPFLDRHVIFERGIESFLTCKADRLLAVTTSGSTGVPGRFLRSVYDEADCSARWRRVYAAYGCGPFAAQINLALTNVPPRQGPLKLLRKMGLLPRAERLAANGSAAQALARIEVVAPAILTGYASAIESLAEFTLESGARIPPPRAVFCTAMDVSEHTLEVAERAFSAPAVDVYVTNEFGVIAWSCPDNRNILHTNDDTLVMEVLDASDNPVAPGTVGELVVTSLSLRAMPLIRYRMGDLAARIDGPCGCGRGLGLLTRVKGRSAHSIRRSDGGLITNALLNGAISRSNSYLWLRRFQMREEEGGWLRILAELRANPTEQQQQDLIERLQVIVGPDFRIALEPIDNIPLAPSGKLQTVVPLPPDRPR